MRCCFFSSTTCLPHYISLSRRRPTGRHTMPYHAVATSIRQTDRRENSSAPNAARRGAEAGVNARVPCGVAALPAPLPSSDWSRWKYSKYSKSSWAGARLMVSASLRARFAPCTRAAVLPRAVSHTRHTLPHSCFYSCTGGRHCLNTVWARHTLFCRRDHMMR